MTRRPYTPPIYRPARKKSKITPWLGLTFGVVVLVFFLIFDWMNPPPAIMYAPSPIVAPVAPVAHPTATGTPTPTPSPTVAPTPAPAPTPRPRGHRRPLPHHGAKFACTGGEAVGLERCSQ